MEWVDSFRFGKVNFTLEKAIREMRGLTPGWRVCDRMGPV